MSGLEKTLAMHADVPTHRAPIAHARPPLSFISNRIGWEPIDATRRPVFVNQEPQIPSRVHRLGEAPSGRRSGELPREGRFVLLAATRIVPIRGHNGPKLGAGGSLSPFGPSRARPRIAPRCARIDRASAGRRAEACFMPNTTCRHAQGDGRPSSLGLGSAQGAGAKRMGARIRREDPQGSRCTAHHSGSAAKIRRAVLTP